MDEFQKLKYLAAQVRCYTEILASSKQNSSLAGYCCIGSRYLHKLAIYNGIHCDFIYGHFKDNIRSSGHCWIEHAGLVVDVTATQFLINNKVHIFESTRDKRYRVVARNSQAYMLTDSWTKAQNYKHHEEALNKISKNFSMLFLTVAFIEQQKQGNFNQEGGARENK